jgi:hypothetical protein
MRCTRFRRGGTAGCGRAGWLTSAAEADPADDDRLLNLDGLGASPLGRLTRLSSSRRYDRVGAAPGRRPQDARCDLSEGLADHHLHQGGRGHGRHSTPGHELNFRAEPVRERRSRPLRQSGHAEGLPAAAAKIVVRLMDRPAVTTFHGNSLFRAPLAWLSAGA